VDRDSNLVIIGAGPYGLACAGFLRHSGVEPRVFGEPMGFWRSRMPRGMLLRSRRRSSHIADPTLALTIERYEESTGARLPEPIELRKYLGYADWYRRNAVPEIDDRRVKQVDRVDGSFRLTLQDGDVIFASRVVVAAGLAPFAWRPSPLGELPEDLVSHSADHLDFQALSGKRVMVVGAGQSALESAALLHEAGADVEIVARAPGIVWLPGDHHPGIRARMRRLLRPPTDVGGMRSGWMAAAPELLRRAPGGLRPAVTRRCVVPMGAAWLRSRLEQVPIALGRGIASAGSRGARVRVVLDDGTAREADHVLLGTGFRVDVAKYPFLSPELIRDLDLVGGYPRLGPGLEASVPGLHFVGAPATLSYGPLMRFVVGTWYAAPALTAAVLGRRQRVARLSYKPRIVPRRHRDRARTGTPSRRRPLYSDAHSNGGGRPPGRVVSARKRVSPQETSKAMSTSEKSSEPR
jgi:NADPH-dependent 2,4-dienoyl-CoA reductase/sulfur reductase-like enzyme